MAQAFADADHLSGGGHVRAALDHYVDATVRPILTRDCPTSLRGPLLTAAGRVLDIAGFTAFDSGDHDLARERYRESLHLLDIAGAAASSGRVLTDLAMLAVHQNQPLAAREHAEAAVHATCAGRSRAGQARALAVLARAHALNHHGSAVIGQYLVLAPVSRGLAVLSAWLCVVYDAAFVALRIACAPVDFSLLWSASLCRGCWAGPDGLLQRARRPGSDLPAGGSAPLARATTLRLPRT